MNPELMKNYLVPVSILLFVGFIHFLNDLLAGALSLLISLDVATFKLTVEGLFYLVLTWIIARFVRLDIIHGLLESRIQREIPKLMGDITGFLVFCVGGKFILTQVLRQDITALRTTGGIGIMVWDLTSGPDLLHFSRTHPQHGESV